MLMAEYMNFSLSCFPEDPLLACAELVGWTLNRMWGDSVMAGGTMEHIVEETILV